MANKNIEDKTEESIANVTPGEEPAGELKVVTSQQDITEIPQADVVNMSMPIQSIVHLKSGQEGPVAQF
jgi:hypothetical protein